MELIAARFAYLWFVGGANRLGLCRGVACFVREMRVIGDVSTGSTSGEGDSATPNARMWNATNQSVAPTGAWTARTTSTIIIVE